MKESFQNRSFWVLFYLFVILGLVGVGNVVAHEVNKLRETDDFKIEVTDVRLVSQTGQAYALKDPFYALDSMVFDIKLMQPGDSIVYEATVSNTGDQDAYLNDLNIRFHEYVEGPIKFTVSNVKIGSTELRQNLNNKIIIEAVYDDSYVGVVDETNNHISVMVNLIYRPMQG